ncbi:MAG: hypothetical protein MI924_31015, partial [Chloroflexales bacterium]|nr:hypothetical protein [Chloroflexales bacterium]
DDFTEIGRFGEEVPLPPGARAAGGGGGRGGGGKGSANPAARLLPNTGTSINGMSPQEYARSVPPRRGRQARRIAGEAALRALYGPGQQGETFKTQWGGRDVDLVVRRDGRIYAHESKNFRKKVPVGTHELKQVLKDWELMQTEQGYTPIWHFWDAGPTDRLAAVLQEYGIGYIVYK